MKRSVKEKFLELSPEKNSSGSDVFVARSGTGSVSEREVSYCGSSRGCRAGATGLCQGPECPTGASLSLQGSPTGTERTGLVPFRPGSDLD